MKEKRLSKYKDYTVLENLDTFDKRKFQMLLDMSVEMQKHLNELTEVLYTFQPLMQDIWATFYKANPQLKENVSDELIINQEFLRKIMNDELYENYRFTCMLDEITSAIATIVASKKIYSWLYDLQNEQKELMQEIQDLSQIENPTEEQQKQLKELFKQLAQEFKDEFNSDSHHNKTFMENIVKSAEVTNKQLIELLTNGKNKAELKKVPFQEQIRLAEMLATSHKLQQVAIWAGRMKSIALKKQKSKHDKAINPNGVSFGSEVENILPSEWLMYAHPSVKMDFLRRFVEGQTLQYDKKGKEELGKGPIICCLDQSGSMSDLDTQAKGFLLALIMIAKRQKRDFAYIPFSYKVGKVRIYKKGKISASDITNIASEFLNGGTDFQKPLQESLNIINQSRFKKADIIFITDGQESVSKQFIESFNEIKKEKDFKVISLVLSSDKDFCEPFSDKVYEIEDFTDENAHIAFEI